MDSYDYEEYYEDTTTTHMIQNTGDTDAFILRRRKVLYCGACGMPPEYCEYSPDYETHCRTWLQQYHPTLIHKWYTSTSSNNNSNNKNPSRNGTTDAPATTQRTKPKMTLEERLIVFYEHYEPSKVDSVKGLVEKYRGKEEKLWQALITKYGPEPVAPEEEMGTDGSPNENDDDDDDDDDDDHEGDVDHDDDDNDGEEGGVADTIRKKTRRGAGAKKKFTEPGIIRVVVQKVTQKKKRNLTVVNGMETVPNIKLKDVAKSFSKKFAGSSSVKDHKSIIVQGDHLFEAAELVIDQFHVPADCVFLDIDGEITPFK